MIKEIYLCSYGKKELASISQIAEIQNQCLISKEDDIIVKFDGCEFISPSALTIIGSLPVLAEQYGKKIKLDFSSIENLDVLRYLVGSGFINFLNPNMTVNLTSKKSIPFKRFDMKDIENTELIYDYTQEIIKHIPVKMDEDLKSEITSKIYEIFKNAFDHSQSTIGVFGCGHYYENRGMLNFSLYDAGIGIPNKVRQYLRDYEMAPIETLKWALHSGNSTVIHRDYPRGLGLELLSEFIKLNNGNIRVYSDNAFCNISNSSTKIQNAKCKLIGTMFNIEIKNDSEYIYKLE